MKSFCNHVSTSDGYSARRVYAEPYKRLVNQSEVLDEMKDLKIKMREGIIESTPKPYQTRAKTLYQSLEPFLKFNERGEIYTDTNQLISRSRLEDLVQHAVRDRRRSLTPTGWPQFRRLLQEHNVPKFMLNRDTLDEIGKDEKKEELRLSKEILMQKLCCFSCAERELPEIEVEVTCPSTCCVSGSKSNLSRRQSSAKASHGRETKDSVLRPETPSRLCLDSETSKSDRHQ